MGKDREPTDAQELTAEDLRRNIGKFLFLDGHEEDITGADFIEFLTKGLDLEHPDPEAAEKLETIFEAVLETPELVNEPTIKGAIDAIQVLYDYLKKRQAPADPEGAEPAEVLPMGTASGVEDYVITKDLLTKAIFGEPGRNGKTLSILNDRKGTLTLWETGKGKDKKEVAVYTRLEFDREALKAAGVTIGKNVSKRAREVFGAMLSHYLAGNRFLTLRMIGKIIFNISDTAKLTDAQKKYIIDGAQEVFGTSLYVDTEFSSEEVKQAIIPLSKAVSKQEADKINRANIKRYEQLFPGRITSAYVNSNLVETVIELFSAPTIYKLQNALDKGQILRVPVDMLEIEGRTDEDLIIIRAYLLRRIEAMKHAGSLSRMIIFKNILDELEIDPTDRAQRNKPAQALKRTERILDYWKEEGYINNYKKLNRKGDAVTKGAATYKIEVVL